MKGMTLSTGDGAPNAFLNPGGYDSIVQGTWVYTGLTDAGGKTVVALVNTSHSNADELTFKCSLGPGTYRCSMYLWTGTDESKIQIFVDGVSAGTVDCYAAATAWATKNIDSIVVSSGGIKTIRCVVASKNAASSDYYVGLVWICFVAVA